MHPVVWNITSLDAATEAKISELKKAVADMDGWRRVSGVLAVLFALI